MNYYPTKNYFINIKKTGAGKVNVFWYSDIF